MFKDYSRKKYVAPKEPPPPAPVPTRWPLRSPILTFAVLAVLAWFCLVGDEAEDRTADAATRPALASDGDTERESFATRSWDGLEPEVEVQGDDRPVSWSSPWDEDDVITGQDLQGTAVFDDLKDGAVAEVPSYYEEVMGEEDDVEFDDDFEN